MGVQNLTVVSPPDGVVEMSTDRLRPQSLARWENNGAGGTTTYQVLHEWDTDSGFGTPITDTNTGLSSTTFEDIGVPPSDMGPTGTAWYYRFTVTDDDDSGQATSAALYDMTFADPKLAKRRLYMPVNVQPDFRPRFVTFDEITNQWFSGADINILQGDEAHIHKSIANWVSNVSAPVTATPQIPPQASPPFGGVTSTYALEVITDADVATPSTVIGALASTEGFALSLSIQYSATTQIFTTSVGKEFRIRMLDYDGGDVLGNSADGAWTTVLNNDWTEITVTGTTAADAVNGLLVIECRNADLSNVLLGTTWYQAAHGVRLGAVADFVPSLNLNNDVYVEFDGNDESLQWVPSSATKTFPNFAGHTTNTTVNGWHLELNATGGISARRSQATQWTVASPGLTINRHLLGFLLTLDRMKLSIDGGASVDSTIAATSDVQIATDIIVGHSTGIGIGNSWFGDAYGFWMYDGEGGPIVAHWSAGGWPDGAITDLDTWTNPSTGRVWTAHGSNLTSNGGLDTPIESKRYLYLPVNVGPGFGPGDPDDARESERHLYLPLNVTTDVPIPFIFYIEPIVVDELDSLLVVGQGFDNGARDWNGEVRLYDNPDPTNPSATYVVMSETSFTAGATQDEFVVTVGAGSSSGWVVVWNDGTP